MAEHRTYLELSEDNATAHKFYEVVRSGTRVTITYGRIGTSGQRKVSDFATEARAEAAAAKKIAEKTRKGYAPAVRGVRQARPISRRTMVSTRSTARQAPVLWRLATGAAAFGIFVDQERCWVGNQNGDVYTVTTDGTVTGRYRLPNGVKCIVADDFWIYAGCDDGRVYDLSGKVPRVAYEISANVDIYWLDIDDAILGVSDRNGRITTVDHEDEYQWSRDVDGDSAWMVRCDAESNTVYHGHSRGVACYSAADGKPVWQTAVGGNVLFGWQESRSVYAATGNNEVYRLAKKNGEVEATYRCDAAVFACATSPDGRHVFAGDNHSSIYCFDEDGTRLWKLGTGHGSAYSMQFLDDRVYIVTTDGSLVCIDASETAIHAAQQGSVPKPVDVKVAASLPAAEPAAVLETTSQPGDAVILECYQDGSRLRVRVISEGYEQDWNVQFPKEIRHPGTRYAVEGVRTSGRGGFYRAYGEIRRLL